MCYTDQSLVVIFIPARTRYLPLSRAHPSRPCVYARRPPPAPARDKVAGPPHKSFIMLIFCRGETLPNTGWAYRGYRLFIRHNARLSPFVSVYYRF